MTVLHQDIGDGSCLRTSVTIRGLRAWSSGPAVADVGHAGRGSGVLGEDLAVQIGDGEFVAVGDDEDLLEPVFDIDLVEDLVDVDGADAADLPHPGVGGQVCWRWWLGMDVAGWHRPVEPRLLVYLWPRRLGFRSCFPRGQRGDPTGQSLMGALGVVDVVERVDLGLSSVSDSASGCLSR